MPVDLQSLRKALPRAPEPWLVALLSVPQIYGIDTPIELASFCAQLAHESSEFTRLEENLNYSAARLMQVWPSRFPDSDTALAYAHNPEKLANYVYANRMGNGPPESGDGWRYRGRCPIQLTGANNYKSCAKDTKLDIIEHPDLLLQPIEGITVCCWYWQSRDLDRFDDDEFARQETKAINGGTHGLARRQEYLDLLIKELA